MYAFILIKSGACSPFYHMNLDVSSGIVVFVGSTQMLTLIEQIIFAWLCTDMIVLIKISVTQKFLWLPKNAVTDLVVYRTSRRFLFLLRLKCCFRSGDAWDLVFLHLSSEYFFNVIFVKNFNLILGPIVYSLESHLLKTKLLLHWETSCNFLFHISTLILCK